MKPRKLRMALSITAGALVCAATFRHAEVASPGIATASAAEGETTIARGDPYRATRGDLTAYVPPELALRDGAFDVVVHFHGAPANQERNAGEAGLRAVIVSANEGMGSTPYARAFAAPGSLDRALDAAASAVRASGRAPDPTRVRHVALSSWSAGGASVRAILEHDEDRVDAVLLADGIFSRYTDPATKAIEEKPLEPFVRFARHAIEGDRLMLLTHTAIETPQYPNVKECTDVVLGALDLPASDEPVYALDRGELHVRGSAGKGPADHVAELQALDRGYALLARRWSH